MPAVAAIFTHYVRNAAMALVEQPLSVQQWRIKLKEGTELGFPFLVAQNDRGEILGFAYASPWAPRGAARRKYAENSIYLRPGSRGFRLGTRLMKALISAASAAGIRQLIAVIADTGAESSIKLHEGLGYKEQSHMGGVQRKFGKTYGTVLYALKVPKPKRLKNWR